MKEKTELSMQIAENSVKSRNKFLIAAGLGILLLGLAMLFYFSTGYTVYYNNMEVGFVSSSEDVVNNIPEINEALSIEKGCESVVYEDGFSFEKGFRLFKAKSGNAEIAALISANCAVDVNKYDVYVDDVFVAQDSDMEDFEAAVKKLQDEYIAQNPDEDFVEVGFVEKLSVTISKDKEVYTAEDGEIYSILKENLHIKTKSKVETEEVVPYTVEYEPTDTKECGETSVKVAGKDGIIKKTSLVEKADGQVIATADVSTDVVSEVVNQVVLVGTKGLTVSDAGMVSPSRGQISSRMGPRWGRTHKGIDICGDLDDPIYVSMAGTVTTAEYKDNGYGNMIIVDHGNGMTTVYAHLNSISVNVGDQVYPGQVIGAMGSTGRSTGVHLHFEVRINDEPVNPLDYVNY